MLNSSQVLSSPAWTRTCKTPSVPRGRTTFQARNENSTGGRHFAWREKRQEEAGRSKPAAQGVDMSKFPLCNGKTGPQYMEWVSEQISKFKKEHINLKEPAGATFTIGDLEDAGYREGDEVVNGWGMFYLPKTVKMQVIGFVERSTYPCDKLVLMTCEDKKVYGYDGEDLHEVAASLDELCLERSIKHPSSKSYYNGEAFKDMTKEDWAKVKQGPVWKEVQKQHHEFILSKKARLLENIRITRLRAARFSAEIAR